MSKMATSMHPRDWPPRVKRRLERRGWRIRPRGDDETTMMMAYAPPGQMAHLAPGDSVAVRTEVSGRISQWLIGFLTRVFTHTGTDKRPTRVNHWATVIRPIHDGAGFTIDYEIAEALGKGGYQFNRLVASYGDPRKYSIAVVRYRPTTIDQRAAILAACEHLRGKRYGYGKIVAHAIDYTLTTVMNLAGARGDVRLARRLCTQEDYPMCSWAWLYERAQAGIPIDTPLDSGSPDDIWDELTEKAPRPWQWLCATGSLVAAVVEATNTPTPVGDCFGGRI